MVAILILTIAMLGMLYVGAAAHKHLDHGERSLRAIRLAEHLLEEIQSRPYQGNGADRLTFCLNDYNGFHEDRGELKDLLNEPYGMQDQTFSRTTVVFDSTVVVSSLENAVIPGKTVIVTVEDEGGRQWSLTRFIPEPSVP